jgi:hypothetical protein
VWSASSRLQRRKTHPHSQLSINDFVYVPWVEGRSMGPLQWQRQQVRWLLILYQTPCRPCVYAPDARHHATRAGPGCTHGGPAGANGASGKVGAAGEGHAVGRTHRPVKGRMRQECMEQEGEEQLARSKAASWFMMPRAVRARQCARRH